MKRYCLHSKKNSTLPFPTLVSVILFHEKIWPYEQGEKVTKPDEFRQYHLNLMGINFKEASGQSRAGPSQSRASKGKGKAPMSVEQGPEMSSRPSQSILESGPFSLASNIRAIVEKAISDALDPVLMSLAAQNSLSVKLEFETGKISKNVEILQTQVDEIQKEQTEMEKEQSELSKEVLALSGHMEDHGASLQSLKDLVSILSLQIDRLEKANKPSTSTQPNPKSSSPTSSSPSFAFASPAITTPIISSPPSPNPPTVLLKDQPEQSAPKIIHSGTSTATLLANEDTDTLISKITKEYSSPSP